MKLSMVSSYLKNSQLFQAGMILNTKRLRAPMTLILHRESTAFPYQDSQPMKLISQKATKRILNCILWPL